jgi:hypothetical protein
MPCSTIATEEPLFPENIEVSSADYGNKDDEADKIRERVIHKESN